MKTVNPLKAQGGLSLLELIFSLVILSISFTGSLHVFHTLLQASIYPMIELQAIAMAESIFEEPNAILKKVCKSPKQSCKNTELHAIDELVANYTKATHKQFETRLWWEPKQIGTQTFKLWHVELYHKEGFVFKFSELDRWSA